MLDLGSPDVWPSTREKAASWEKVSYVRNGFLTLWDAANLMDPEGYGGIYETCSKAVQQRITGLYVTLKQSLQGSYPCFLGYAPAAYRVMVETSLGVEELPLFPGRVFLEWVEQHKLEGIDGRFFERYLQPCEGLPVKVLVQNPFWGNKEPERNTPYFWRLSRKKELTVNDFACFYCGAGACDSSSINLQEEMAGHILASGGESFYDKGLGCYRGYLCGYESANEAYFSEDLEFPVEAYIAFLKEVGLDVPREWAHSETQAIEEPSPVHDEEPAAVDAVAAQEEACVNACEEDGRTASDDVEILDGLTLGDFRRYLESNPPLKYVLPIVVKTSLLPDGNPARTQWSLKMDLNISARKGWGTGKGGGMADSQARAIEQILLPQGRAGAGNKKTLRVLPEKEK